MRRERETRDNPKDLLIRGRERKRKGEMKRRRRRKGEKEEGKRKK